MEYRKKKKVNRFKNHFAFNDVKNNRIECFTNLNTDTYIDKFITLRTGKFRISRNDTDKGVRYFINDSRELEDTPNAVIVFNPEYLELIEAHEIQPIYTRDDINVYAIREYNHPNIKKRLIITDNIIHEESLSI